MGTLSLVHSPFSEAPLEFSLPAVPPQKNPAGSNTSPIRPSTSPRSQVAENLATPRVLTAPCFPQRLGFPHRLGFLQPWFSAATWFLHYPGFRHQIADCLRAGGPTSKLLSPQLPPTNPAPSFPACPMLARPMPTSQITILSLLCLTLVATGCRKEPAPESANPPAATSPATPAAAVQADTAADVAALEAAGFVLTKNSAGNVVELSIGGSQNITDVLSHLSGVPNVEKATFTGPGIDDNGMENLSAFTRIKRLDFTDSAIADATLATVGKLDTLEALFLRRTGVTNEGLSQLAGLKKLRAIDLRNSNIGDAGMDALVQIESLADIQLEKSKVTDAGLVKLASLKLKSINFNYCTTISNATMKVLGKMPTLESLQADYSKVNDEGMKELAGLRNLKRIRVRGCDVTGTGLAYVKDNPKLARFELRDSSLDAKGLEILSAMPQITFLDMSECRLAKPDDIAKLGKVKNLTYLGLWETKTNDETVAAFGDLTNLTELNLKSASVGDDSLPTLMKLTNLKRLNVAGTLFSDDGFRQLGSLPKLQYLNVANTSIGFDVIDELAESREDLEVVEFEN